MSLRDTLASTAERIASHGTHSERSVLEDVAIAARSMCPGASAALVDWNGSEIMRLRAFSVVHRVLLREIATADLRGVVPLTDAASAARAA